MTGRLGVNQLRLLTVLGCPATMLVIGDALSDSLVTRGLLRQDEPRRGIVITPAGLRALADALEAGRVTDILAKIDADRRVAMPWRRVVLRDRRVP